MDKFTIRTAGKSDAELLKTMICEMAEYEQELHMIETNEERILNTICNGKYAEALIGEVDGNPVAYAVFFHTYSTYLGKPSLYLEDVFVRPAHRGKGYGKAILKHLAALAKERGCDRFDWSCLNWNTSSIEFYLSLNARKQDERTYFRLQGEALDKLAES